jgi:hypothetical protein
MGSRTTGGDANPRFFALKRRNTLALLIKDVPARVLLRNLPAIVGNHLLSLGYSARAGRLVPHLKAWWAAARAAPQWRRARREILGARRIEVAEFDRFVSARR